MSVIYFNERTGDEVRLSGRSARLDSLSNWKRVGEDEPRPQVVNDGILSRPSLAGPSAARGPGQVLVEATPPVAGDIPVKDTPPVELAPVTAEPVGDGARPNKSASKADWQAYARTRAQDADEAAEIDGLTRDELVARYGGGS